VQDGWQELDASGRRSREIAVDCSRLMMMMICKYFKIYSHIIKVCLEFVHMMSFVCLMM
jgi:hypothetical protein